VTGGVAAGGNYSVTAVNAIQLGGAGATTQSANGAVTITSSTGQVTQGNGALVLTANSDGIGTEALTITAPGGITLGNTSLSGGDAGRQSAISLAASGGQITIGTASGARLGVAAQSGFTANGAIIAGNGALLADPVAGPATVDVAVTAGGITTQAITVTGADHDIRLAASGAIATGALAATRSVSAGGVTSGSSAASFSAPSITAINGAIGVRAGTVTVTGAQSAGTTISLDATSGALQAGLITATGGDVTLAATGRVTLNGAVNAAGRNVTVTASDADIAATVTAAKITLIDRATTANTMRIGTNPGGTGGFVLDQAEFDRLSAPSLVFDGGTGAGLTRQDIAIGGLAISNPVVKTIDIYGLQRIDLTGNLLTSAGSTLTGLRLGGTATATDLASVLRVAAKADGTGGSIDVGTASLNLRSAIIGVGQDTGFLELLGVTPGTTGGVDPRLMVNNILPGLYSSSQAGGLPYLPAGQQLIRASSMSVSYSNFALFQNTALPGENGGAVLGSLAIPSSPAVQLAGIGSTQAGAFAIFGQINGIGGIEAALLGNAIVNVTSVDRTVARINGCLIGSGAGCLSSVAVTPTLGTFDPVKGSIFFARTDFELPFDPLVGTNNDSLFGDVGTFGLSDVPLEPIECDTKIDASCAVHDKDAK
jgi:hypothetical protein